MKMTVADVMTTKVVTVRADTPYKALAALLREHRVSGFPAIDDKGKVIGIVSEADLLAKEALEEGGIAWAFSGITRRREQAKAEGVTAADLMSKPVLTIGPDEPAVRAAQLMYGRRLRRIPVVSADGRLIGIVARSDVLGVFGKADGQLGHEVSEDILLKGFLIDPDRFVVTVEDGIVTIEGKVAATEIGHAIVRAIRHAEGVVAVRDRLSYPPPSRHTTGPLIWN